MAGRDLQRKWFPLQSAPARGSLWKPERNLMSTVLLADPICREHLVGVRGHPERPERFEAVLGGLRDAGLLESLGRVDGRDATEEELTFCHTAEYLRIAKH